MFSSLETDGYATGIFSENPFLTELDTGLQDGFKTVEGESTEPLYPSAADPHEYSGDLSGFLRAAIGSGQPVRSLVNGLTTKLAWDYPALLPDNISQRFSGGVSRGSRYTDHFLNWEATKDEPWAACINYMDAHHPYSPRAEHNRWADDSIAEVLSDVNPYPAGFYTKPGSMWRCEVAEHLYDGAIRQVDYEIGRLVETLEQRDVLEETLLVVTADHGDGFGEPSRLRPLRIAGHAIGGHEVNFHVPLVVKYPNQERAAQVTEPVSLTQFPDVVRAVRDREVDGSSDPFVSDAPVVSVGSAPDTGFLDRIRNAGEDTVPFEEVVRAVYEPTEDNYVRKHFQWKDEHATEWVFDANTVVTVPSPDTGVVAGTFESFTQQPVRSTDSARSVDEGTKKRLERLGYR
ncbi:hypothetical protein GCM10009000_121140 [Halobacterium noricense]